MTKEQWIKLKRIFLDNMDINELNEYFKLKNLSTYERSNFDLFIEENNLNYDFKSIHITGTNGKGSTANFLYHIYLKRGYKVGFYNSPFFSSCLEMVQLNGKMIGENEYLSIFKEFEDKFEKYQLTAFEMQTIIAYEIFKRANLDVAIIEVGMGGFIDATNIITPVLSIITTVSLEHTQYLGRSISEIAYNKAGIIKYQVPTLVGKLDETAMFAIRERAKDLKSPLVIVEDYFDEKLENNSWEFDYRPYKKLRINSGAKYQIYNACLAIEATKILSNILPINEEHIIQGLEAPILGCRFELIRANIIIDGAHNPEGIAQLCDSISNFTSKNIHIIFACFRDKNVDSMLVQLGAISSDVTLTTFNHKRARTEDDYFLYLSDYKFDENYLERIKNLSNEFPDDYILVTGSLAFAGLVKEQLK